MAPRIVAIATVLAVVALYLYYTAQRLDGLHRRVDIASGALEAQLHKRSATAVRFAGCTRLPADVGEELSRAADDASILRGLDHEREVAENALSAALGHVATESDALTTPSASAVEMHDEALRASFARRFHNDAVRDALVVRDRRTVRWLRLAGSALRPSYFEMDDEELPSPAKPSTGG